MFSQYYLRLARNYRLKDHLPPIGSRVSIARAGLVSPLSLSHPVLLSPQAAATVAFPVSKKFPCNKHTGAPRRRPAPQAPQALTFAAACGRAPCPRRCAKTGSSSSRTEKSTS